jgi:hypothetical protein
MKKMEISLLQKFIVEHWIDMTNEMRTACGRYFEHGT